MINAIGELLSPLRTAGKHSQLQVSPTDLDIFSVLLVIALFICRQVKYLAGLGTPFAPFTTEQDPVSIGTSSHGVSSNENHGQRQFILPDLSLSMPLRFGPSHKIAFNNTIKQDTEIEVDMESNRALIALFLGALSEPAMLLLLCKRGCPVRPLGSVKVRHRFEIFDVAACQLLLEDRRAEATEALVLLAKFPHPARKVRKGIEIDIEVSIVVQSDDVRRQGQSAKATRSIFRQKMTILQFVKWKGKTQTSQQPLAAPRVSDDKSASASSQTSVPSASRPVEPTRLPKSDFENKPFAMTCLTARSTRSWASFCKDYNPIHVSPLVARLLGLSGVIAHGNHVAAACFWTMAHATGGSKLRQDGDTSDVTAISKLNEGLVQVSKDKGKGSEYEEWAMELAFKNMLFLPAAFWPRVRSTGAGGFEIVHAKHEKVVIDVRIDARVDVAA